MKRSALVFVILIALLFALSSGASAWTLYWNPVTSWSDNTAIESQHLPMSYIVEWDGAVQPATVAADWPIPQPSIGHGLSHTARVKAKTATGVEGPFSSPFPWNSPEGILPGVLGIGVRQ